MVIACVSVRKCSCLRLVDTGFEALGSQDRVNVVVDTTVGRVPCRSLRRLVQVKGVGQRKAVASSEFQQYDVSIAGHQ